MILRRIQGIRIDDVMIALTVHDEIALIITGGDEGAAIEVADDRVLVAGLAVAVFRTLHRADPLRAIAFDTDRTHITAEVQEEVFRTLVLNQLCSIFRRIALADAADVQAHLRVLQVDSAGCVVDDDILDVCMLRGFLQCGLIRQLSVCRIFDPGFPLVMPEMQHCAVGDIDPAIGEGVDLLAPFYEGKEIRIDNNQAVFSLIGTIQEETHRFAITYHRQLRSKRLRYSELDSISGIGPKRKQELLRQFKSIQAIRQATLPELERLLPKDAAAAVYSHFQNTESQVDKCESLQEKPEESS